MDNKTWWLLGEVKIPEEKKEKFNKYVLDILDKCGIRKTEEIVLCGKKVTVVRKVVPDENGMVHFDYSIFEKVIRKVCTYDLNTCKLYIADEVYDEFGIAMELIMALQEAYTDGDCYMMFRNKPFKYMKVYMELLYSILGKRFYLNNRGRVRDMLLFFENSEKYKEVSQSDIISSIPWEYTYVDEEQTKGIVDLRSIGTGTYGIRHTSNILVSLYSFFQRETEDEFLEFWNGNDLKLSKELESALKEWNIKLRQMRDIPEEMVEEYLVEIILDLREDRKCRLVDKEFVEEILNHKKEVLYRKALALFRIIVDKDFIYFPELTRKQVLEWVIKSDRSEQERIMIMAYLSLFINNEQRKIVLGF